MNLALGLGLGIPLIRRGSFGVDPASLYLSASLRPHHHLQREQVTSATVSGNTHNLVEISSMGLVTPAYPTNSYKICFTNWYVGQTGSETPVPNGEQDTGNPITIDGAFLQVGSTYTPILFSGSTSVTIADGDEVVSDDVVLGSAIPAGTRIYILTHSTVSLNQWRPRGLRARTSLIERRSNYGSTQTGFLSDPSTLTLQTLSGNTFFYGPTMVVCKGNDGRPVPLCVGDSMGYGQNETGSFSTANGALGWLYRGLDSTASGSLRLPGIMLCHPSSRWAKSTDNNNDVGQYFKRKRMLSRFSNRPFTCILTQMGLNANLFEWPTAPASTVDVNVRLAAENWWSFLKNDLGGGCKLIGTTISPRTSAGSNSFWTDLANQNWSGGSDRASTNKSWDYAAHVRSNAAGFLDDNIDITPGFVDDVEPFKWRLPPSPFSGALTANATTNVIQLNGNPSVGTLLAINVGQSGVFGRSVISTADAGGGNFNVTLTGGAITLSSGALVKEATTDDGLHSNVNINIYVGDTIIAPAKTKLA